MRVSPRRLEEERSTFSVSFDSNFPPSAPLVAERSRFPLRFAGGEYASPKQTTFHHFRDFWEFDVTTHAWERLETKVKPSPRSGCR